MPAYFNDSQRQATKDAGKIAGLEVQTTGQASPLPPPLPTVWTAKKDETIAVFDFGGGTFDISILEVGEGVVEVKSTNGDTHLGGDNIDQRLIGWIVEEFKKDQGIDLSQDKMALQRLREASEKAKMELSSAQETDINLPFITAGRQWSQALDPEPDPLQVRTAGGRATAPHPATPRTGTQGRRLDSSQIDEVVLVGGSTRIPKVQELVKEFFGKDPHKGVNPE